MNNMGKMVTGILLAITLPIFIYIMISNNIGGFLVGIIGVVYLLVLLFISVIITAFIEVKAERKDIDFFESLDKETQKNISNVRENLSNKTLLSHSFMDKNNILMILSFDTEKINWKLCVLKDKTSNKCYYISSEYSTILKEKPYLNVSKIVDTKYKYNEEKLVYTGATVGGITMGGFHVEGGNYSKQNYLTGKYGIIKSCYINGENIDLIIDNIYLNSDLLEKAECCFLKEYIEKDNHLLLKHALSKETAKKLNLASSSGDYKLDGLYNYMSRQAETEMRLTKDECIEIKNWLFSNMN